MAEIMQGFPVAVAQRMPRQDWDRAPWNRWSFQNVRQILPTTEVWRGDGEINHFSRQPKELGSIKFKSTEGSVETIQNWIDTSYTDGILFCIRGPSYSSNITTICSHAACIYLSRWQNLLLAQSRVS